MPLSHTAAQHIVLAAQGLAHRPAEAVTKETVRQTIERMGLLQIDTISVVARSQYFVLWSRLGEYPTHWLDELLDEGRLFEYWGHSACLLPIADYPLYRRVMLDHARSQRWLAAHAAEVELLRERLRMHGPVRSADFARAEGRTGQGWWDWKPEKVALEWLFMAGEVMVAKRQSFQRVYDLRERVMPEWDDAHAPTAAEAERAFVRKTVRALGIAQAGWVAPYFYRHKKPVERAIAALVAAGELVPVEVEGWDAPGYVHRDSLPLVEAAANGTLAPDLTTFLSPFDPLVSDRARANALFGFSYTIEAYTPAHKRRYGYFTLPILHRGQLVGRLDAKAHRKEGMFEVRMLHLEPAVTPDEALGAALGEALRACAVWHKTPRVVVRGTDPAPLAPMLERAIAQD